jgi:predicted dehydrogenase
LTCRLLLAAGCKVVGIDLDNELVQRAAASGVVAHARADVNLDPVSAALGDLDAVIVTASTASDDPVRLAGALARDRGRVVVVGAVGLNVPRSTYYDKEIELRVSRSYGPGRYDPEYEERGLDYPIGYVRWTEQRNMAAFVDLLSSTRISVEDLITEKVPIDQAPSAYDRLMQAESSPLGLVITYGPAPTEPPAAPSAPRRLRSRPRTAPTVGVIGAGSFAQRFLIPGLRDAGFELSLVASATGLSAAGAAERFTFGRAVEPEQLLGAEELDAVAIATRHASHATYATAALKRGRAVFVEKPPALSLEELDAMREAASGVVLQVGFNRRYAPLAIAMRDHIATDGEPVELLYRIAAGRLPENHWLNDPHDGGGRLLGEGCHFVDFACWLMGHPPDQIRSSIPASPDELRRSQRFAITLTFPGGSIATILYGSESAPQVAKELIEVHSGGRSATLSDYRRLELRGRGRSKTLRNSNADKGHAAQFRAFRDAIEGNPAGGPSPLDTMEVTLRAFEAALGERDHLGS